MMLESSCFCRTYHHPNHQIDPARHRHRGRRTNRGISNTTPSRRSQHLECGCLCVFTYKVHAKARRKGVATLPQKKVRTGVTDVSQILPSPLDQAIPIHAVVEGMLVPPLLENRASTTRHRLSHSHRCRHHRRQRRAQPLSCEVNSK